MGWLLGAGIGFFLGGPLGAVMGGAVQHVLSQAGRMQMEGNRAQTNGEQIFIAHLVAILTKVAMADGSISPEERKTIHSFFSRSLHYRGRELRLIDAIMEETEKLNPDLHETCKSFDRFADKEQRLLLLDLIYQVAVTDQVIREGENEAILRTVSALGIGSEEHERIKSRHAAAKKADHYQALGLAPSAGNDEIKRAYRQLAAQYHPDKVSHLGPELIAFANEKFKAINEAYAAVRKERNI
jgi:DnaJ like chaperone protein